MEKLLTIVIPSYNVEKTLRETVESMLVPDAALRCLLDILIVNDGSKDGTLALARQLEADNPGVVRVWNKENGGHGSTINVGIDYGYGKYLKVVDGDDWLDTDALEKYLKILQKTDADVVATDYYHYYMSSKKQSVVKSSRLSYGQTMDFSDIWDKYTFFMHSLAVKTMLLREQPYRIDEHCFYVDVEFDTLVALVVKSVLYVDLKLYVYRLEQAAQSVSVQGWIRHYKEHEQVVYTMIGWYNALILTSEDQTDKKLYFEKRLVRSGGGHYQIGLVFPANEREKFVEHLKEYDEKIKQMGEGVYKIAGKLPVAKFCRLSHFSKKIYAFMSAMKKIKQFFGEIIK